MLRACIFFNTVQRYLSNIFCVSFFNILKISLDEKKVCLYNIVVTDGWQGGPHAPECGLAQGYTLFYSFAYLFTLPPSCFFVSFVYRSIKVALVSQFKALRPSRALS